MKILNFSNAQAFVELTENGGCPQVLITEQRQAFCELPPGEIAETGVFVSGIQKKLWIQRERKTQMPPL